MKTFFLLHLCLKRNIRNFWFSGMANSLQKYRRSFQLGARNFRFQIYKRLFQSGHFHFPILESCFLKYVRNVRLKSSISGNIRMFSLLKWKKVWGLRTESTLGSYFYKTFRYRRLTVFWICPGFWVYTGSEYACDSKVWHGSEYTFLII